jgi:hypothetical protein
VRLNSIMVVGRVNNIFKAFFPNDVDSAS